MSVAIRRLLEGVRPCRNDVDRFLPDSIHHIVNRGNDKKIIFPEPPLITRLISAPLLREARERFEVELYAYCLMPNHFHLVVPGCRA